MARTTKSPWIRNPAFAAFLLTGALSCVAVPAALAQDRLPPPPPPPPPNMSETSGPSPEELFDFLPPIVAMYNDREITSQSVKESIPAGLLRRLARGQTPDEGQLRDIALNITQQLINEQILIAASRAAGYDPDPEAVKRKIDAIEERAGPEKFDAGLRHQGITRDELYERVRRTMSVNSWIQNALLADIDISEDALRELYQAKQQQLRTPERVSLSHILFRTPPDAREAEQEEARTKAEKVLEHIRNGADFEQLAREHSDCDSSSEGGKIGTVRRGESVPPFETAAFSLADGEVSDVVKTQYGYHLIKVHGHHEPEAISFERARPKLQHALQHAALQEALEKVIEEGRRHATIQIMIPQQ